MNGWMDEWMDGWMDGWGACWEGPPVSFSLFRLRFLLLCPAGYRICGITLSRRVCHGRLTSVCTCRLSWQPGRSPQTLLVPPASWQERLCSGHEQNVDTPFRCMAGAYMMQTQEKCITYCAVTLYCRSSALQTYCRIFTVKEKVEVEAQISLDSNEG